jgi:hypothetical protein
MLRYLVRELAGWFLVGLGLCVFYLVYVFCEARYILEAIPLTIVGIFIFRGGIHLLKMAVAARICREAQDRLYPVSGSLPPYAAMRPQRPGMR